MSDNIRDNAMLTEDEKISFGEKLKATRESKGLSVQDAAGRLHLSPRFITLLENENLLHTSLPLIYLRGYLRSYARLLSIPETELAQVLEKLDPPPLVSDPLPIASADSLSLTFPLENNRYYTRIATFFIFIALFTSMTTWWYLHANTASSTLIVLKQPLTPEQNLMAPQTRENAALALNDMNKETPLHFNKSTALENVATHSEAESTPVPGASVNLTAPPTLTLAAAITEKNKHNLAPPSTLGQEENDDENADEQE